MRRLHSCLQFSTRATVICAGLLDVIARVAQMIVHRLMVNIHIRLPYVLLIILPAIVPTLVISLTDVS